MMYFLQEKGNKPSEEKVKAHCSLKPNTDAPIKNFK